MVKRAAHRPCVWACAKDGVLNAKHKARLAVWLIHSRTINDIYTDDQFTFSRITKVVKVVPARYCSPRHRHAF